MPISKISNKSITKCLDSALLSNSNKYNEDFFLRVSLLGISIYNVNGNCGNDKQFTLLDTIDNNTVQVKFFF